MDSSSETPPTDGSDTTSGRAISGLRWVFLGTLMTRVAQPVFTVLLARILAPDDFGVVSVALVFLAFVSLFQDLGLRQALVQRKEATEAVRQAVFWGGAGLGFLWFLAVWMAAPAVAGYYADPHLGGVLRGLSLVLLIGALAAVPEALLQRELEFRSLFRVTAAQALVPGVVGLSLAYGGAGVWALVAGTVAGAVARVVLLWRITGWRIPGGFGKGGWHGLWHFGKWVSLEAFLGWCISSLDHAIVGRVVGMGAAGLYRVGYVVALLPAVTISGVIARVSFPAFSRIQDQTERVREAYLSILRLVAAAGLPAALFLGLTADPLVRLLLDPRWYGAVPVLQFLSVAGAMSALVNVAPPIYQAIGRVDVMPKFFLGRVLVTVPVYLLAAQYGLIAMAAAHAALALCFGPLNLYIARRVLRVEGRAVLTAVGGPLIATAGATVAALLPLRLMAGEGALGLLLMLLATATGFGLVYLAILRLAAPATWELGWRMGRRLLGGDPA